MRKLIFVLVLLFSGSAFGATYVDRAQGIIDGVIDGTSTVQQQQNVASAFITYRPDLLLLYAIDPENPTNEEKAQVFVEALRLWGREILRSQAEKTTRDSNEAAAIAAGAAAEGDL